MTRSKDYTVQCSLLSHVVVREEREIYRDDLDICIEGYMYRDDLDKCMVDLSSFLTYIIT